MRARAWMPPVICAICALSVGSALAESRKGGDVVRYRTGSFFVTCTSSGQICDPAKTKKVRVVDDPVRIKRMRYVAATAHCSRGRILVFLDGDKINQTDFVNAGERATVDNMTARLAPGRHRFAFRFEGRTGGCNAGFVGSWGGKITLTGERL
jgi:hypothetical protein